jgi:16S rRNA G1207 methylase RsmC
MGLVALDTGATEVVMSDLNMSAVENARYNLKNSPHEDKGMVFESNLFERIPSIYKGHFDVIFFNPPFHNETVTKTQSQLAYAFKTQHRENNILVRFLEPAKEYLAPDGVIYIGFSNKDKQNLALLETSLEKYDYIFELVEQQNSETIADNRIYKVTPRAK